MKLAPLVLGDKIIRTPIIQGGMGVGVSRSSLAAAVANEGGIGVISSVQIGYLEPDFETNTLEANLRALRKEIKRAKELSPDGFIGLNVMVAVNNYDLTVKTAVEEGIDMIISGAGLPTSLPSLVEGSDTKIAPIVSSGKAAHVMCKLWDKRYKRIPDLIVIEGPEAGGHLGFSLDELQEGRKPQLKDILKEVFDAIKPYEEKYGRKIPVAVAGGIFTGKDIAEYLMQGASAVQMATRFIATEECDADINYKKLFTSARKEDIMIVKSPVGMPGRAIKNKFIEEVQTAKPMVIKCYNCLKPCNPKETPYCISKALINAVKGNVDEGLIFTGSNAYRIDKIVSVKELIEELVTEAEKYYSK